MKVKIHKNTIRRIICEELDRLGAIDEKVAQLSYGRRSQIVTTRLADNESGGCDINTSSDVVAGLHTSIQSDFTTLKDKIRTLLLPAGDDQWESIRGKARFKTYMPYNPNAGSSGRSSDDALSDLESAEGGAEFTLINAVDTAGCPASYSFLVRIAGESDVAGNLSSQEVKFFQWLNKEVESLGNIQMKTPIPHGVPAANALDGITNITMSSLGRIDAMTHPDAQELYTAWTQASTGVAMCPADGSGDSFDSDALLGDGESGSSGQNVEMVPCADLESAQATTSPEDTGEEEAAAAAAPREDPIALGHRILSQVQQWWQDVDTDATFGQFKSMTGDDGAGAGRYYEQNYWPQDLVDQLDGTQRSRIMRVLAMIKDQMDDTIINDVDVDYEGTRYHISDDKLDI